MCYVVVTRHLLRCAVCMRIFKYQLKSVLKVEFHGLIRAMNIKYPAQSIFILSRRSIEDCIKGSWRD